MTKIKSITSQEEEEKRLKKEEKNEKKKRKKELKTEKKLAEKNAKSQKKNSKKPKALKQTNNPELQQLQNKDGGAGSHADAGLTKTKMTHSFGDISKAEASCTTSNGENKIKEKKSQVPNVQNDVKLSEVVEINEPITVDIEETNSLVSTVSKRSSMKVIKSPMKLKNYIKSKTSRKSENNLPETPISQTSYDSVFEKEKKKKLKISFKPKKTKSTKGGGKDTVKEKCCDPIITKAKKIESKPNKTVSEEIDENVFLFGDETSQEEEVISFQQLQRTDNVQNDNERMPLTNGRSEPLPEKDETASNIDTMKSSSMNRAITANDMKKAKKFAKKQRTLEKQENVNYEKQLNSAGPNSNDQLQSLIASTKETESIMRDNVGKVIDREENLTQLYITTKSMEESTVKFIKTSKKVKKMHKCKNKCPCCWPCYRQLCCITAVD